MKEKTDILSKKAHPRGHTWTRACVMSVFCSLQLTAALAQFPINYQADLIANAGSGDMAPYYISSNNHGIITQEYNALLRLGAWHPMTASKRFSYGFGVDFLTGYGSKATYSRYDADKASFVENRQGPSAIWLQQLYGEIKFRGVFLTVGLKEHESNMLDSRLSSGDLIESGNARPIPEVRAGFIDFQNIPFTNGWVQIDGEISYGKFTDNGWMKDHFNYYNYHLNDGPWYTYKRAYFRTKPSEPFSLTIGAQAAGNFGGTTYSYSKGAVTNTVKYSSSLKQFFKMFIPSLDRDGPEGFVDGNHLGSWDVKGRYRLRNDMEIMFYHQIPCEDGSGIGLQNGFDGVWGLEYKSPKQSWINGAVIEYLDFTNQSGPMHWEPQDNPGTTIVANPSGNDNYYNNGFYNSYANYGMSIGTPFIRSTIYNSDGYLAFTDNRVRGFHIGVTGNISEPLTYRILFSYRRSWGTASILREYPADDTSMLAEVNYGFQGVKGLKVKAQVAFDRGELYGNTFGACLTVSYNGIFNLGKK